jgi:sulfatase maturation enzyme AslB (radical SAM superfamily)
MEDKHDMTEQVARDIVKYIVEHANRNQPVSFEWFGGEPLTNTKVVDIITSGVRSAGFDLHAKMVSNGYLFNEENVRKAATLWGITNVQITLDGYGE